MRSIHWFLDRRVLSTLFLATAGLLFYMIVLLTVPSEARPGSGGSTGEPTSPSNHKVTICHNGHLITVDRHALPAHLRHGDSTDTSSCSSGGTPPTPQPAPEVTPSGDVQPTGGEPVSGAVQGESQQGAEAKGTSAKVRTCDSKEIELSNEENRTLELHNQARKARGLALLCVDPNLTKIARDHSKDMAQNNYFGHNSRNGETPGDRLKRNGYSWRAFGENVAWGSGSNSNADNRFKAWLQSPGHRTNIYQKNFKEVGIGVATSDSRGEKRAFYTVDFGTKQQR